MKVAILALAFAACIAGASACGKFSFNDEGVGSWTGGCTGAKISAIDGSAARTQYNIISKVKLYYSAEMGCVKGLQARHGWANPPNLVTFGATNYAESKLSLTQGEYITSVSWAAKDGCITYLSLKTNKDRDVTAGSAAGAKVATFTAKDGEYLAAFKGATGNDKSCSPLAALSFRWGFDDCEAAAAEVETPAPVEAPVEAPAEVEAVVEAPTCEVSTVIVSGVATCADGVVSLGGKAVSAFTCEPAECAAEAAPAVAPAAAAASASASAGSAMGGASDAINGIIAGKVAAVNSILAAKQAAAQAAVEAVNGVVAAKVGAVNSAIAAKTSAVNGVIAAKTSAVGGRKLKFFGLDAIVGAKLSLLNAKLGLMGSAPEPAPKAEAVAAAPAKSCFKVCASGTTVEALKAKLGSA